MVDLATLAMKVDSTEVATGVGELNNLTDAGAKAEKSVGSVAGAATRTAAAMNGVTVSAGAQRAGMQQLGMQLNDAATMFSLGSSASQIFASQLGQTLGAVQLMTGGTSKLAMFLGGPWGIAIGTAAVVLVPFIARLFESGDAADAAAKKYRNAADEARGLIGAMNSMALNEKRMEYNKTTESLMKEQARVSSFIKQGNNRAAWDVINKFVKPLQQQQIEQRNLIGIAERENAAAEARANAGANSGSRASSRPSATRSSRETVKALTEEQRAYEQAVKGADRYIESLDLEIQRIGKTPEQLRALEIGRAKEAAATDGQRKKIDELSAAREAALAKEAAAKAATARDDYDRKTLQPLRDELALIGITGTALIDKVEKQKLSALASEEESYKADMLAKGLTGVNGLWLEYYMLNRDLIEQGSVFERDKLAAEEFADALSDLQSIAGELDFSSAFGPAGSALNDMADSMARLDASQKAYAKAVKAAGGDQVKIATATAAKKKSEVNETMHLISATKNLFKEQSAGYKIMEAAEKAYAAVQAINTIKSVAAGAAKIFSQLGVFAFPVVGAMVALMAGLGFSGGSSSQVAPTSAEDLQDAAGTGSVLGDASAKSESIANAIAIVAENSNKDLEYSNSMLRALRSIDTNISALSGNVAKQIQVSGSMFDTSKANIGQSGSSGFLGLFASSTTRSLYDLGLTLTSATVADIIAQGISGQTYQIIQQVKKNSGFLGIGGGTKTTYETTTGAIDASIAASIADVVASLRAGMIEASSVLGIEGAAAVIDAFQINIGKISFAGMTGQEIEDQLNAIFSNVGDQMAGAVYPALAEMQLVGEGAFETFIRVARQYQVVDTSLKAIGMTFGSVGLASVKARDELVQLFGSLDDFASATAFFGDNFLSEAEQIAPVAASVREELARLGLSGIATREQFKNAVLGIDLTSTAGRELYASLLAVAPAFDKVAKYAEAANKKLTDGFAATVKEFEGYAKALAKYRDSLREGDLAGGNVYLAARRAFLSSADLAAQGDAGGLSGLENAGKAFLTASKANATSLTAYLRDVALVAGAVDKGIFAATETADYAQLQLDAINNSASILASIDAGIANVEVLLGGTPAIVTSPVVTSPAPAQVTQDTQTAELNATIATQNALLLQVAQNTSDLARLWSRLDGDGMLIRTDADTPIQVETV